ncbi:unnamed protein product [Chrysodeixis includens]|uniref:Sulfatase N-terminal domain-containing protein n=1 Tax=Chrysodeixis includens TaxID=689277 RepID=A0A9N8KS16_CHRIL|nr:unnamed protein product [Chrysodeixis includens]
MLYLLITLILVPLHKTTSLNVTQNNVLLIIIDDLRHLSEETINLPNIKKIANKGVYFKNAFAQQAVCAPSRNSMLTGRRPDALRLYDFYSYWRDTVGNFTTLPQFFKENGFETYSVGKVFNPGPSSNFTDDYPLSWTHFPYHPSTDKYKDAAVCKDAITKKLQRNLICPVDVSGQPRKTLPDLESLKFAINILSNRNSSTPFFLAVGFHKPHIPLKFPKQYLDRVPINKVEPPKHPSMPRNMPLVAWHPWSDLRRRDDIARLNISFPLGLMPKDWSLKIRQSYYAAASYIDDLVGVLMSFVDRRKTIVVLTSDHGWSLGENGLWAKYSNFDVALKVPLIFSAPGIPTSVVHTPVELVDIFPTLVDLSGIAHNISKCHKNEKSRLCFEGKSLKSLMIDGSQKYGNYLAFSQYPRPSAFPQKTSDRPRLKDIKIMGYSVRTKRFRYTEWVSFNNKLFTMDWNIIYGLELYDHIVDSEESNNLYLVHKYKNIKQYLSGLLRSHFNRNNTHIN